MKIRPLRADSMRTDGRTDELRTDMMKVIVACRSFANASKTHSVPAIVVILTYLSRCIERCVAHTLVWFIWRCLHGNQLCRVQFVKIVCDEVHASIS